MRFFRVPPAPSAYPTQSPTPRPDAIQRMARLCGAFLWCLILLTAWPAEAQRVVTSAAEPGTSGDGECTFREALGGTAGGDCPNNGDASTIHFNIPGTGPHVIQLNSQITLNSPKTIDGSTQPGAADVCNLAIPDRPDYPIILDGGGTVGSAFFAGSSDPSGSTIRGLNIRNFNGSGIAFTFPSDVTIQCNFIGTDETGTLEMANGSYGVIFSETTTGNLVGGTDPGDGNLISGNGVGGIRFVGTNDSLIQGNYIGTDKTGILPIPNGNGVHLRSGARNNLVGGTTAGSGNLIAFNQGGGIEAATSPFVALFGNSFLGNTIFENFRLGIDLEINGVTANDGDDSDFGPNRLMNFPELTSASIVGSNISITYRVTSSSMRQDYPLRIEFFYADVDGEEGKTYIGFNNYNTPNQTRTTSLPRGPLGSRVVATATDDGGNTSEFSPSVEIENLPVDLSITKTASVSSATPGSSLSYTIVASGHGPEDGADARVRDTFPGGLTCTYTSVAADGASDNESGSGNIDDTVNLPPGSSITYTANCLIDPGATGTLRNTARVNAAGSEVDNSNNSALVETPLVPEADVSVSISGPSGDLVAGQSATYTIIAANPGPSRDRSVQVLNTLPSELTCSWTAVAAGGAGGSSSGSGDLNQVINMPPGSSKTYTMNCSVDSAASGNITNTASVTPSVTDPDTDNNTASTTHLVRTAKLEVEKTGSPEIFAGGAAVYTVSVHNSGTLDLDPVSITDVMPAELENCTFNASTLGPPSTGFSTSGTGDITDSNVLMFAGSRLLYVISCDVPLDASGTIRNTASATWGGGTEPDTSDNTSSVDIRVTRFDLATEVAGPSDVDPGDPMSYTLTLRNRSNAEVTSASFSHTPSSDLESCSHSATATGSASGFTATGTGTLAETGIVMAVGSRITYTVDCTVRADAFGPILSTGAAALGGVTEVDTSNNSATLSTTVNNSVDLAISKLEDLDPVPVGGTLTYTVTVSHASGVWDPAVLVQDPVPTGLESCTWTSTASGGATGNDAGTDAITDTISLPPGSEVTYTYSCTVRADAPDTLSNTATVTASRNDSSPGNNSATITTDVRRVADIAVTKTNGVDTVTAGDATTWTVDVSNAGPSDDPSVSLTDSFPANVENCTWTSTASSGASGNTPSGTGDLSETLSLDAGANVTYTIRCDVLSSATGTVRNVASATASVSEIDGANNSAVDEDSISQSADSSVTKTNGTTESVPGGGTTYTVVVSNAGPSDDSSVRVTDSLPAALGCTWTSVAADGASGTAGSGSGDLDELLDLPAGASVTYTLNCSIDSAASGTLSNTATIDGSLDENAANDSATETDTLVADADIAVTKTNGGTTSVPGTSTTYTVVASNLGPSDDSSVSFTDTLASALTCTWTSSAGGGASGSAGSGSGTISETLNLPAGASVTYALDCDIDPGASGILSNTANVAGSFDGNAVNDAATDSDTLSGSADISVTKTNGVSVSTPGTSTTYSIVASNAGPSDDPSVQIVDNLPTELSCTWTSTAAGGAAGSAFSGSGSLAETLDLPVGASVTYTFSCNIDSAATGSVSNTVTVSGSFDGNAANDSATDTDTLSRSADISVTKTNGATDSVPGTSTTYTVVASNAGPSDDSSVQVGDTLPSELACTWTSTAAGGAAGSAFSGSGSLAETLDLPAGASVSYTFSCDIDSAATGSVSNTATVSGSFDTNAVNDSATDTDTLSRSADISVAKTNGVTESVPGTSTTYTVVASNAGPSDDSSVTVADTLPSGLTCTWTSIAADGASGTAGSGSGSFTETLSLPAGASVIYTLSCDIDSSATGSLSNTATVAGSFDDNAANDSATDTDTLSGSADISVTKSNGASDSVPGTSTTYTVVAANAGPSDDSSVRVVDSLPSDLTCTWTSTAAGGASGSVGSGSGSLAETLNLPAGASVTYTLTCDINSAATGSLINTAAVTGSFDDNAANDSATDTDTLSGSADISVTKSNGVSESVPGTSTTYTVVAANAGPSDDPSVGVVDILPSDLTCTWTSSAASGASGSAGSGSGSFAETLDLPAGASVTYTFSCDIDSAATGSLSNTAAVTGSFDGNAANDSANDTDSLSASADISVTKTNGVTESVPGNFTTYTVVAANAGPSDDPSVAFVDTLPSALGCTWSSSTAGGATGSAGSGSGSISETLNLPAASSVTYTLRCDIDSAATGSLSNTATVAGSFDAGSSNNSATDTDNLQPRSDIAVLKSNGTEVSTPGGTTTYTIGVVNGGRSDDPAVTLTDTLPAALTCTYSSVAIDGATGNTASGTGSLAESLSLPAGSQVTYTLVCDIDPAATGSLTNTATVTGSFDDGTGKGPDVSTDIDTLQPAADIGITKTNGVTESIAGAVTTYGVVATNAGPSDDPSVRVVDNLPSELTCTWTSTAAGGASGSAFSGSGSLAETLSLPAGASMTYTLTCDIDSSVTGSLSNTAAVTGSFDGNAANDSVTDTDTLSASADISVTKTNGVSDSVPGTSTTYTVIAANAGPSDDSSVQFVDNLPSELTCTWTSSAASGASGSAGSGSGSPTETLNLPAGSSVTYTLTCDIDSSATGSLSNTAAVTGSFDDNAANDSATDTDSLSASADISVTKTNGVSDSVPGTSTTYTVVAANAGPSDDSSVSVVDTLPSALTCTWTSTAAGGASGSAGSGSGGLSETLNLPAGSSVTYTLTCDIDSAANGSLSNTASVSGSFDSVSANNSATDTDTLSGSADISVTKTNGVSDSVPGTSTTYTVVAANAGPSDDSSVSVVDTLPSALTCTWTSAAASGATGSAGSGTGNLSETLSLPAGASVTYTLDCDIDSAATGSLGNTATVSGSFDSVSANDSATDTDTLSGSADISVTKTNGASDSVPGTSTTYTVVAANAGPSDDSSVSIVDAPPSELTCTWTSSAASGAGGSAGSGSGSLSETLSLPAGSLVTYTFSCDIDSAATGTLSNTASVTGSFDGNSANDSATDTDTLSASADISIAKTNGVTESVPGTSTSYTVVAANVGPSDDPSVAVGDTPPAELTCTWTSVAAGGAGGSAGSGSGGLAETLSLPAGSSVTYTLDCDIDSSATGSLSNTATISGSFDANLANDAATDTDTLAQSADISITKTNGVTESVPGTSTTYTLVASNAGPSDDPSVEITDTLPAELTCTWTSVAAGGAAGSAGSGAGSLIETLDLPAGSSLTYTLLCAIDPAAVGLLVNTAEVSGSFDDTATNDSATDSDSLAPSADLSITKTNGVTESVPGTSTTYTLVASNAGPSSDAAVLISDSLPSNLDCSWTSVSDGGAAGSAGSGTGSLSETVSLPFGASLTYTLDCTIDAAAIGTLENTAEVEGSFDPENANDSATDSDTLLGLDYGDAPDSLDGFGGTYPTLVANDGARHVAAGPRLGALRDSEDDATPDPDALGDDGFGQADEDGVILPELLACEPATVEVTASEAARLDAWIDWNRDGDWLDDGEQLFTDEALAAGLNSLGFEVPCDAASGEGAAGGAFARFRLSSAGALEASGLALDGEVEDYLATVLAQDFGDAPESYGTLLVDDGARHGAADRALILGELWDPEADGQSSPAADGDDAASPRDDEDGVSFGLVELVSGQRVTLPVTVSGDGTRDGFLQMWIDFDRDGTFDEGDERVAADLAVPATAGAQQVDVVFTVPTIDAAATSFARIRISSTAGLGPAGAAADGEVEDYQVQLIPLPSLSIAPVAISEGDAGTSDLVFTLIRSHNLSTAAVTVATADGTAQAPGDYAALAPSTVTFIPGGSLTREVTVTAVGDQVVELDEAFTLALSDPVAIAAPGGTSGTILNDDSATLTLEPAEILEGDSGQSTLAFLATLDAAVDVAVTVGATTSDQTATVADGDYAPLADQKVTFLGEAGETQTISVAVNGDMTIEDHEELLLTVADLQASGRAVAFAGGTASLEAVGTILNDDALLRVDDVSALEGDAASSEFVFTVSLEGVIEGGFEVEVQTEEIGGPTGATSGPPEPDFEAALETLIFTGEDGESRTVAVTVFGDTTPEPTETFLVRLSPATGGGALPDLEDDEGLGTIEDDDDGVPPTVESVQSNAGEITACAQLRSATVRTLAVRVEDDRSAILGGDRPADYLLVRPGVNGDFDTESCAVGVQGDDRSVPIRNVDASYGETSLLATLDVGSMDAGIYRLLVCDSITDEALNALDGDLDDLAGGDKVIPFFRSDAGNLFMNGHIDGDVALCPPTLQGWMAEAEPPTLVATGLLDLDDFEGAETSTSIRISVDGGAEGVGGAVLAQCVTASGEAPLRFALQAQARQAPSTVLLEVGCEFFAEPACAGVATTESVAIVGLTEQPGWLPIRYDLSPPSGTSSALCQLMTGAPQMTYELFLDALTLTRGVPAAALIFSDDFESGDTSAWQ